MLMSKVYIIGDTHFPFHSKKAYKKMLLSIKREKPTHVIQIGDLLDQYVFSKYSRSLDITPQQEIDSGLKLATEMWKAIKKIVPKAKCYQLLGNHDVRLAKRIADQLPELSGFFSHKNLYNFAGVKTMTSDRDFLVINNVIYAHGWLSKSIDHAKFFNKSTVHGHRHRPAIETDGSHLWSLDVGYLADNKSLPLQYTASKYSKWTTACGIVENGKPRIDFL